MKNSAFVEPFRQRQFFGKAFWKKGLRDLSLIFDKPFPKRFCAYSLVVGYELPNNLFKKKVEQKLEKKLNKKRKQLRMRVRFPLGALFCIYFFYFF